MYGERLLGRKKNFSLRRRSHWRDTVTRGNQTHHTFRHMFGAAAVFLLHTRHHGAPPGGIKVRFVYATFSTGELVRNVFVRFCCTSNFRSRLTDRTSRLLSRFPHDSQRPLILKCTFWSFSERPISLLRLEKRMHS